MSRTISPSTRSRGPRARRRLYGSFASSSGVDPARLPVGGRGDDQPVQRLEAPAAVHELAGQPVEQLGMARRPRPGCRSPRRVRDQAGAEVRLPDPVDERPAPSSATSGSTSHFARVSRVGGASVGAAGGGTRARRADGLDRLEEVAPLEDAGRPRLGCGPGGPASSCPPDAPSRAPRSARWPPSTRGRSSASRRRRRRPARASAGRGGWPGCRGPASARVGDGDPGASVTERRNRPRLLVIRSSLFQPPWFCLRVNVRTVPSGNSIGFSGTKTAWRATLRRPGPASMPQAVSSLPSMANADRAGDALAGPTCRRSSAPAAPRAARSRPWP